MGDLLLIIFVFLTAGVLAVPLATKLGFGSVLGYLIAGIVISPILVAFGVDVVSIQHIAEFGVVMMLFLVGLELEPRMLWSMRARLLGLGGLQVTLTTAAIAALAVTLGQPVSIALVIGLILSLSSTAIVLQTLNEKGLMKSDGGHGSFSVLLFQDIAFIPMLAVIPLLALPDLVQHLGVAVPGAELYSNDGEAASSHHSDDSHGNGLTLVAGLNGWQQALVTVGAMGLVIIGGTFLTRPLFRYIAIANMREIFIGAALLWVVAVALLMTLVGLSPALGTFLAGVVLANSEYRHQLEGDIDPFKGLLLGLFFITVGAAVDFGLLFENFFLIIGLTLGLMTVKAFILLSLTIPFKIRGADRWLFGLGMAQAGEFGFVLLAVSASSGALPDELADKMLLVVALSMLLTPGLYIFYDRMIAPRYISATDRQEPDEIDTEAKVIIAGHGRFGGTINRLVRECGYDTVVLDYSSTQLETLRAFGLKVFFGDATRPELLHAAGIENATILVVALDGREQITGLVRYVHEHFPNVHIVSRAVDRPHAYELFAAGASDIVREYFDASVRAGRNVLEALGEHPFEAERKASRFFTLDRSSLREMAELYDPNIPLRDNKPYLEKAKALVVEREQELKGDHRAFSNRAERDWSPPSEEDVAAEAERAKE